MTEPTPRRLAWFSCGAASAVTTKLALVQYGAENVTVAYTNPGSEHPDNQRFLTDCEKWFGVSILRLQSSEYTDTWDVWDRRQYILGNHGAPCTIELKKKLRFSIERDYDIQLFGYTAEETGRAQRFREQNPDVKLETPLIERGLGKADCLAMVERAGIALPAMYALGYRNNNCIGCPKGGMGYWNKIRRDFPDVFARMSELEQRLGHAVNKDTNGPVFLGDLDPARGNHDDEPDIECSLLCAIAEEDLTSDEVAR